MTPDRKKQVETNLKNNPNYYSDMAKKVKRRPSAFNSESGRLAGKKSQEKRRVSN